MQSTSNYWARLLRGLEVAVVAAGSEDLLGVRQGFVRYFHHGLRRTVPIAVVPHGSEDERQGLLSSDHETLALLRRRARALEQELDGDYSFYAATAGGLHSVTVDGVDACFVRCWTVISSPVGEAWGGSGSLQIPDRMLSASADPTDGVGVGTRRRGGLISSLTARLETRRSAAALATFHALSTLFHGRLEG